MQKCLCHNKPMKLITETEKILQNRLVAHGMNKAFAHQLATGRRMPSLKLAQKLYLELGIDPMTWRKRDK